MSNFMKFHPVGAKLYHVDGHTDRHEASRCVFATLRRRLTTVIPEDFSGANSKLYTPYEK
jgi:hypothetical protein